jgi:hypothetical protein
VKIDQIETTVLEMPYKKTARHGDE